MVRKELEYFFDWRTQAHKTYILYINPIILDRKPVIKERMQRLVHFLQGCAEFCGFWQYWRPAQCV